MPRTAAIQVDRDAQPVHHGISSQTINGIDFLRGAFAVLVLLSHSTNSAKDIFSEQGVLPGVLETFHFVAGRGSIWVYGFFVISGFCIQHSVRRSISQRGHFASKRYLLARFTRIYPLYLIGLAMAVIAWCTGSAISAATADGSFAWSKLTSNLLLLQGFGESFDGYGPSWSITNEFAYYLMIPVLLYFTKSRPTHCLLLGMAGNVVWAGVVIAIWKAGDQQSAWLIPLWTVPALSILWFAGALLAQFWDSLKSSACYRCSFLLLGLALPVTYLTYLWIISIDAPAVLGFPHSYASIATFALLILATDRMQWLNRPRVAGFCRWFGLLSYPLYLFHAPIQQTIVHLASRFDFNRSAGTCIVVLFAVPLLFTILTGPGLERNFLARRKRWLAQYDAGKRRKATDSASSAELSAPHTARIANR